MKKRVIFIEHDHASPGGPIWVQFERRGYEITRFIIVNEENANRPNVIPIWPDLLGFDVVVVMGAQYAVYDEERIGNWLLPQLEKMREVHNAGIPVLGICFGGQLMSRVLGGTVSRSPRAELGWFEVESADESLVPRGPWFQYHWDRFTFPPGSTEVARNDLCPQAFVYGRTLGTQFHPEVDAEVLDMWLAMDGGCAEIESEGIVVEDLRAQTKKIEKESNQRGYDLVDQFLDRIATAPVKMI
ncbi:MAG: type 1 glutamine amidotransferase [Candidatus Planktophila sp.]|nr:type 1 glutamine amidotransferase [Candidatus Planktophila sp.]